MIKQRQLYILKLSSSRLKEVKYNIKSLTISEAKLNRELIAIADNQVLRSIREITGKTCDMEYVNDLFSLRDKLKRKEKSRENSKQIRDIQTKIDNELFMPYYVTVKMDKNIHYTKLAKSGFKLNGRKYVRFSCSASQARVNTVVFVWEEIYKPLTDKIRNGHAIKNINCSKYNAYFGLATTSTTEIPEPRVVVVKDCKRTRNTKLDFVYAGEPEDTIKEIESPVEFNYFDGQGIMSPEFARRISDSLELEHTIGFAIIRQSFVKGMVCTFDFKKFADDIALKREITDIYGNVYDIHDVDIILTESQFKLWEFYSSWEEYVENYRSNNLKWGISKYAVYEDPEIVNLNYQAIQTLNLNDEDIIELCSKTVNWINGALKEDINYQILFSLGKNISEDKIQNAFKYNTNHWVKALMLSPDMIEDSYVKNKIYQNIKEKIKEASMGRIITDGSYQVLISDPYALCEHIFEMEPNGLLGANEYYSNFCNDRNIKQVGCFRSPITHMSEWIRCPLKNNPKLNKWYKYLHTGLIVNVNDDSVLRWADSDFDGDFAFMIYNEVVLKAIYYNLLPISYERPKAPKLEINNENLMQSDLNAFGSEIGEITNYSTSMYAMLPLFEKDSEEYKTLQFRLKYCRKAQGETIDKAKTGYSKPFYSHWVKFTRVPENGSTEEVERVLFNNKIIANKKPYFFRYLYRKSNTEYKNYIDNAQNSCSLNFNCTIENLRKKSNKTEDEEIFLQKFDRFNPLNDSDCTMNKLCRHIEKLNDSVKLEIKDSDVEKLCEVICVKDIPYNKAVADIIFSKMNKLISDMNLVKQQERYSFDNDEYFQNNIFYENIRNEIYGVCSNLYEVVNYLFEYFYRQYPNKKNLFWGAFGEDIVHSIIRNLKANEIIVPIQNDFGSIEYLGKFYERKAVKLNA